LAAKLEARVGRAASPAFIVGQLARFQALYGPPHGRDDEMKTLQAREWCRLLAGFGELSIRRAFDTAIATNKTTFWPPPGVVFDRARQDDLSWRDALQIERYLRLPSPDDEPEPTPEERARVAALFAKWRAGRAPEIDSSSNVTRETPATPDDGRVTPQLRAWAIKHGLWKGEPDDSPDQDTSGA
jgi:hypothetical protein